MNDILKKYWLLILIVFMSFNYFGVHLIEESIGILDALEHVESDKVIASLKRKDFFYTLFVDFVLILDLALILFLVYGGGRKIFSLIIKN